LGLKFEITFLTQHLGVYIFYPNWVKTTQYRLEEKHASCMHEENPQEEKHIFG